ncbi:hypothetical protein LTR37_019806 [Vermiconidia calcicola]|uniref:Uncharacterized protein n=1 Tax=Vermiconidia calcicola TaxID=1690605 RepID=A0ACC3MD44_9PEZI|nr:hypothetical protein LTR37_019806 [Vermiconidia calcicola]
MEDSHAIRRTRGGDKRQQSTPPPLAGKKRPRAAPPRRTSSSSSTSKDEEKENPQAVNTLAGPAQDVTCSDNAEEVSEDDLCPICQLLLCNPVITQCGHTLCKSCMATWADVSISMPNMAIVSVDEEPRDFDAATGLEAKCPMCRTLTTASIDDNRIGQLKAAYPHTYSERESEESKDEEGGESIETITIYIGNRHELVAPREPDSHNQHQWTFFVRPSRTDIIEEVHIHLHPTFRQNHIIRTRPPYSVQRLGWGIFAVEASCLLKAGYSWVSSDAEDSPDGALKGLLKLEWMLDFTSFGATGAMGRCRLKVKSDRDWEDDEAARDQREWERVVRQYERDGRYEPD